jgi:hypothetical protein
MTAPRAPGSGDRFYLDDLQVGQRFTGGARIMDEAQIKAFAPPVRSSAVLSGQ